MQNSSVSPEGFFRKHTIGIIIWTLFLAIAALLFSDFTEKPSVISEKIDPYVLSTKGKTLIFREKQSISVEENKQALVFEGDKVRTLDSTATVFWPDGSITRLGEKSSIRIHEMKAKTANEDIRIDFSLESGKSWSNVVKYMFGDSYFHERFNNDTSLAAVRGTVFELNLERKYIHTIDHGVSIEDMNTHTGSLLIVAGGIFDTNTRQALIQDKIDTVWNQANSNADIIYLNDRMTRLRQEITKKFGHTNYLTAVLQKIGLIQSSPIETLLDGDDAGWNTFKDQVMGSTDSKKIMDIYQEFYGFQNTEKLINAKMKLRDLIIETAPESEKKTFLTDFARSTLYDSWNAIKIGTGSTEGLQKKLQEYIKQGADKNIIDSLENAAKQGNLEYINNVLEAAKNNTTEILSKKNLLEEVKKEINMENLEKINDTATEVRNSITDGFKKFTQ